MKAAPTKGKIRFPKRSFGQKNEALRSFQPIWFNQWPFLHYCEAQDVTYCHICIKAFQQKLMHKYNADPAFVSVVCEIIKDVLTVLARSRSRTGRTSLKLLATGLIGHGKLGIPIPTETLIQWRLQTTNILSHSYIIMAAENKSISFNL